MDAARLERLLGRLFSLEMNTLVKENITATKMPNAAHAFIDVARDYAAELLLRGVTAAEAEANFGPDVIPTKVGSDTFDRIRTLAAQRIRAMQGLPPDDASAHRLLADARVLRDGEAAAALMLTRIRDTSDQLKPLIPRGTSWTRGDADAFAPESLALDDAQRLVLQKAWEIGTEEVVMQTVVYIDGDVITRVRPDWASPERSGILEVHQANVGTSISFWRAVVDVVRALLGDAVSAALGK